MTKPANKTAIERWRSDKRTSMKAIVQADIDEFIREQVATYRDACIEMSPSQTRNYMANVELLELAGEAIRDLLGKKR